MEDITWSTETEQQKPSTIRWLAEGFWGGVIAGALLIGISFLVMYLISGTVEVP